MRDRLQEWYIKHFYRLCIWLGLLYWITLWNNLAVTSSDDHFEVERETVGTFHLVQNSGNLGPPLKVVHFDRPSHFGQKKWNVPFHLTKLLSSVLLFCILLTRTITKHAVAWVRSVQSEYTVPLGTWNFRNFKPEFLLNGKCPGSKFGPLWNSPSVQFNTIGHFTNQKEIGSS